MAKLTGEYLDKCPVCHNYMFDGDSVMFFGVCTLSRKSPKFKGGQSRKGFIHTDCFDLAVFLGYSTKQTQNNPEQKVYFETVAICNIGKHFISGRPTKDNPEIVRDKFLEMSTGEIVRDELVSEDRKYYIHQQHHFTFRTYNEKDAKQLQKSIRRYCNYCFTSVHKESE